MTYFRTHRLFYWLMAFGVIAALFIPNRVSDRGRSHVQVLFAPVSLPTRWFVATTHDWIWPKRVRDDASPDGRPRADTVVYAENERLRVELANLAGQLEHYRVVVGNQESLGEVGRRCTQFSVMGGDSGSREALAIVGRGAGSLNSKMPVLTPSGLIGEVQRGAAGTAHVLLLTDRLSAFTGSFGRHVTDADKPGFQSLKLASLLINGVGGGMMRCDKLSMKEVESSGLQVGDVVVIDDEGWPDALRGMRAGRVVRVSQSKKRLLFAEIDIEPVVNASQLRNVMVMNK